MSFEEYVCMLPGGGKKKKKRKELLPKKTFVHTSAFCITIGYLQINTTGKPYDDISETLALCTYQAILQKRKRRKK